MFVPIAEICSLTDCVAPRPSVTIVITAATPITIPSIVRNERKRLRRIELAANISVFQNIDLGFLGKDFAVHEFNNSGGMFGHLGFVGHHHNSDA